MKEYSVTDFDFKLGEFAIKAMLYETAAFPKPGLVSPVSNGCHEDMNYFTFIDSTSALMKYMIMFSREGRSEDNPREIFNRIRSIGMEAEKEMFLATDNVNTHKGMIFLMGICLSSASYVIYNKGTFSDICECIKSMTYGIVDNELIACKEKIKCRNLTYGEELFLKYGTTGIRGEVEKGIPIVFNCALKVYSENEDLNNNDRLLTTLFAIMSNLEDSNILHRHSMEKLLEVKEKARQVLKAGGFRTEEGKKLIKKLEASFKEERISPGGAADILAVTVFMDYVKKYMQNING